MSQKEFRIDVAQGLISCSYGPPRAESEEEIRDQPLVLDNLTLDQMRVLIAVAEEGSFSAAARRLGRVQSAVSQAIQTLEENLRLTLFDRWAK